METLNIAEIEATTNELARQQTIAPNVIRELTVAELTLVGGGGTSALFV